MCGCGGQQWWQRELAQAHLSLKGIHLLRCMQLCALHISHTYTHLWPSPLRNAQPTPWASLTARTTGNAAFPSRSHAPLPLPPPQPTAYALGFLDCQDISARCMLTIFQFFATKTDASVLRMLNGSPAGECLRECQLVEVMQWK